MELLAGLRSFMSLNMSRASYMKQLGGISISFMILMQFAIASAGSLKGFEKVLDVSLPLDFHAGETWIALSMMSGLTLLAIWTLIATWQRMNDIRMPRWGLFAVLLTGTFFILFPFLVFTPSRKYPAYFPR